ncbi:MAG: MSMEG_1061 family FMN-dependent PPOX-type flavoprotein [Shimia sp.]
MSDRIEDLEALAALYGPPAPAALNKVADRLLPPYRPWFETARFAVLSTVGPDGTDGSPRGDDGPVVRMLDDRTLAMPDWRGNKRLDSLRNVVADGRVSLMLMVPGETNVVRVNGRAHLSTAPALIETYRRPEGVPRCVIVIAIREVYYQCARALMRARLWEGKAQPEMPSAGEMTRAADAGFDAETYDARWPARAAATMWSD